MYYTQIFRVVLHFGAQIVVSARKNPNATHNTTVMMIRIIMRRPWCRASPPGQCSCWI